MLHETSSVCKSQSSRQQLVSANVKPLNLIKCDFEQWTVLCLSLCVKVDVSKMDGALGVSYVFDEPLILSLPSVL